MLPSDDVFNSINQSRSYFFGHQSPIATLPSRGHLLNTYTAMGLLNQALRNQQWAIVKPLLRDMNPTAITRKDYGLERSPLEIASEYGNESIVQALIEAGFAASQSALASALLRACEKGHVKVVKILLEVGADPTRDREILVRASSAGHERVVQLLIQAGAAFQHALEKACANGHDAAVKILLEAGADFTKTSHWSDETQSLELAIRAGHYKDVKNLL
jgi:ankyrin repeat protein